MISFRLRSHFIVIANSTLRVNKTILLIWKKKKEKNWVPYGKYPHFHESTMDMEKFYGTFFVFFFRSTSAQWKCQKGIFFAFVFVLLLIGIIYLRCVRLWGWGLLNRLFYVCCFRCLQYSFFLPSAYFLVCSIVRIVLTWEFCFLFFALFLALCCLYF